MLDMSEVVADVDFQPPQPFTIMRSTTGTWVVGGFQSTTVAIPTFGPVQPASDLTAQMIPEADRIHGLMSFWATVPMYTTRGKAPVPSTHGEAPAGIIPGDTFTLSVAPPGEIKLFLNGLYLTPGLDYTISGKTITLNQPIQVGDALYSTWIAVLNVGAEAADILVYPPAGEPNSQRYRVLDVKHYPGSRYWRAIATRMNAN